MAFLESTSCFVAIPPGNEFAEVRQVVANALDDMHVTRLEPQTADETAQTSSSDMLERADFVIADLTGPSKDILFDLGLAYALRKPVLMMAQGHVDLPADLAKQQLLLYRPQEVSKLAEYLRYWIPDVISLQRQKSASAAMS